MLVVCVRTFKHAWKLRYYMSQYCFLYFFCEWHKHWIFWYGKNIRENVCSKVAECQDALSNRSHIFTRYKTIPSILLPTHLKSYWSYLKNRMSLVLESLSHTQANRETLKTDKRKNQWQTTKRRETEIIKCQKDKKRHYSRHRICGRRMKHTHTLLREQREHDHGHKSF